MNKMMIDPFGKANMQRSLTLNRSHLITLIFQVSITNDGATVLRQLDVQHPAGKLFVQLAEAQERELGDGTTSVVLLGAELLAATFRQQADRTLCSPNSPNSHSILTCLPSRFTVSLIHALTLTS